MAIFLYERMLIAQVSTVMVVAAGAAAAAQLALPNCPDHCGSVTIPYPFGVNENCYMNRDYFINCTEGTAYLRRGNIRVTNISVDQAELQVQQYLAYDCYDGQGNNDYNIPEFSVFPPYTISGAKNKFMAVGCDTYAKFEGFRSNNDQPFIAGCLSQCLGLDSVDQNSCSGIGCCQTSIPDGLKNRTVHLDSFNNHSSILDFNPCSYAFIVQEGQFNFSGNRSFQQLASISQLPMVLNWEIAAPNKSQNFACKGNTKFDYPLHRSGYICQCERGYEGNPYHPNGCQDIDECKDSNPCSIGACVNLPGDYSCECPKGYQNDSMNAKSCIRDDFNNGSKTILLLIISLGTVYASFTCQHAPYI